MKFRFFVFSLSFVVLLSAILPLHVNAAYNSTFSVVCSFLYTVNDTEYEGTSILNVSSPYNVYCFGHYDQSGDNLILAFAAVDDDGNLVGGSSNRPTLSITTSWSPSAQSIVPIIGNGHYNNSISLTSVRLVYNSNQYVQDYSIDSFSSPGFATVDSNLILQMEGNSYSEKFHNAIVYLLNNGYVYDPDYDYDPDDGIIIPIPDPDDWQPDYDSIPVPEVTYLGSHGVYNQWTDFLCDNASPDYYVEMRGCFYTPNELNFEIKNTQAYLYYDSLLFDNWGGSRNNRYFIRVDDLIKAQSSHIDVYNTALESFHAFKNAFPFSSIVNNTPADVQNKVLYRSAINKYQSDYFPAMGMYNGCDFYIRYFTFKDGVIKYGRWLHGRSNVPKSGDRLGGSFDDDWEDEPDDNPDGVDVIPDDPDVIPWPDIPDIPDDGFIPDIDPDGGVLSDIVRWINTIIAGINSVSGSLHSFISVSLSSLGEFPSLLSRVFGFLPGYLISAISASILLCILLRVFGR